MGRNRRSFLVFCCGNLGHGQDRREIIRLLQTDGRASYTDIGAAVHLSANAAADRVRRLLQDGTIVGIHAVVDPAALGLTIEAQIDVKLRPTTSADDFERAIRDVPQVLTATLLTGSFDYALRVACSDRADLAELTETIRNRGRRAGDLQQGHPARGLCGPRHGAPLASASEGLGAPALKPS